MKILLFISNSMESGLGSDIFDVNGADTSRHSSAMERVQKSSSEIISCTYLL